MTALPAVSVCPPRYQVCITWDVNIDMAFHANATVSSQGVQQADGHWCTSCIFHLLIFIYGVYKIFHIYLLIYHVSHISFQTDQYSYLYVLPCKYHSCKYYLQSQIPYVYILICMQSNVHPQSIEPYSNICMRRNMLISAF